jgi:hypothetical protein
MQRITLQEVVDAAQLAYDNKLLGAQHKEFMSCKYSYGNGIHCAVGAAMSPETISEVINNGFNLDTVADIDEKIISTSVNEYSMICDIQEMHDDWANSNIIGDATRTANLEQRFIDKLDEARDLLKQLNVQG